MSEFKKADRVVYLPGVAGDNRHHEACEHGTVTLIGSSGTVFVRFDGEGDAKACSPETLVHE